MVMSRSIRGDRSDRFTAGSFLKRMAVFALVLMLAFCMVSLGSRTASADEALDGGDAGAVIDSEPVLALDDDPVGDDPVNGDAVDGSSDLQLFAQGINVQSHSQADIRAFIKAGGVGLDNTTTFSTNPVTTAPYSPGVMSTTSQSSALKMLNQIRYIAGIDYDVTLDAAYNDMMQAAALVNNVNNVLTHFPAQPAGMSADLYNLGYQGSGKANLAMGFNNLERSLMNGWMADNDSSNIGQVGHRRWVLNPRMGKTGFGLVGNGRPNYTAMYAFDQSRSSSYYGVAWPAQNMPVEYFGNTYPWSISMGQTVSYDTVSVTLTRQGDGQTWTFNKNTATATGYFNVNNDGYGATGCIIFRPASITYAAGDSFRVTISGLSSSVSYDVNFFSLTDSPVITAQPQSADYAQNASASPLAVNAQGEGLKYQWYSNTTNSNTGGGLLAGQTSPQYYPSTATVGTRYYYAVVSNSSGSAVSQPAKITITVPVAGVTLNPVTASLSVGGTVALTATVTPSNATNKAVTWASSDTSVATVDASGKVTALKGGAATITVTTQDGSKKATCVVTVTPVVVTAQVANGTYVIRTIDSYSTTKVVDMPGKSLDNGTKINIWDYNRMPHQRFVFTRTQDGFYTIKNLNSGKMLDVPNSNATSGVEVIQWSANAGDNQKWAITKNADGSYTFLPKLNAALCLDIRGNSKANGADILLWTKNNTSNQKFALQAVSATLANGTYTIGASYVDLVLDIDGARTTNGANVALWTPHGQGNQQFGLTYDATTGYYSIINPASGKALDVANASSANGANVLIWAPNSGNNQKWAIEAAGDGSYRLYSACSGLVLDATGASKTAGTNVLTWSDNGAANQKWKFDRVG